ncbi:MAG: hypothetical protein PF495_01815 [Spirochaetales bacterium]|jgi:hypothetical protein|nr:hypothetical protein [Spirochaetales bacterium]
MKRKGVVLLFLILSGCGTVSQKAPDPFGVDLHHKMDFLEPEDVDVVYPAGDQRDSLDQSVRPNDPAFFN